MKFTNKVILTIGLYFLANFSAASMAQTCELSALQSYPQVDKRLIASARQWTIRDATITRLKRNTARLSEEMRSSNTTSNDTNVPLLDYLTIGQIEQIRRELPLAECFDLAFSDGNLRANEFGGVPMVKYPNEAVAAVQFTSLGDNSILIFYPMTILSYNLKTQELLIFDQKKRDFVPIDPRARRSFDHTVSQVKRDLNIK